MTLLMLFIVPFGCTDDKDNAEGSISFPELQEMKLDANGTTEIAFKTAADWKLISNSGWCKFVNGNFTESIISGKAGEQTITIQTSDDSQNYVNDDIAELTLAIGGKEQVICKITRPRKVFEGLIVKDAEGNIYDAEHPISVEGNTFNETKYTTIIAETEFEVGIDKEKNPSWIEASSKQAGNFQLTFNKENKDGLEERYSIGADKKYSLTLGVKTNDGIIDVAIPVIYEGLDANELSIDPQYSSTLKISKDGKKITGSSSMGGDETIYNDKLSTTIITRNDDYQIVIYEQKGAYKEEYGYGRYYVDEVVFDNVNTSWIHETRNGAEYSLTFDPYKDLNNGSDNRSAVVMAFPKDEYETIKNDLQGNIIDENGIDPKSRYNTYVVAIFYQEGNPTISFKTYSLPVDAQYGLEEYSWGTGEVTLKFNGTIENAGTGNIWKSTFATTEFNDERTIYIEVINYEEGMTFGVDGTIANVTTATNVEYDNDGKHYITLTRTGTEDITGHQKISIKSGDEVKALLLIEFGESTDEF